MCSENQLYYLSTETSIYVWLIYGTPIRYPRSSSGFAQQRAILMFSVFLVHLRHLLCNEHDICNNTFKNLIRDPVFSTIPSHSRTDRLRHKPRIVVKVSLLVLFILVVRACLRWRWLYAQDIWRHYTYQLFPSGI